MNETTKTRVKLLKEMNDYIINVIGDEDVYDYWFSVGIPDEATEEDYEFIAENDGEWLDTVKVFAKCCGYE